MSLPARRGDKSAAVIKYAASPSPEPRTMLAVTAATEDVVLLGAVRVVVQKVYIQRNSAPRGGPLGVSSPSLSLKALGCFGCTLGEGCQASSTV